MRASIVSVLLLLLLAPSHVCMAQPSVNAWPRAEQESAARVPLSVNGLDRVERAISALSALAKREPAYCRWVGSAAVSPSIAAEAAAIGRHAGVRNALASGSLTPREFVELSFALLMAGITHESRQNNIAAPSPTAPAANVAFFGAHQARIERALALDPC